MFYSRPGCHLCESAEEILTDLEKELPITFKKFNIDESDELTEKYGLYIPVIEVDGEMIQYGRFVKSDIKKRLQAILKD